MKKLSLIVSISREEFATFSSYSSFLRLLLFGFVKLAFGAVLTGIAAALSAVTAFEEVAGLVLFFYWN